MIRKTAIKIRDRFREAEDRINRLVKKRRATGIGTAGPKKDKSLYRNGGEFKSRF